MQPKIEYAKCGNLSVAYQREGHGPPLVLVHGAMADSRVWRRQVAGLSDELTVVAWDEPGAGGSSDLPGDFTLADYAECLATLIDALGLEQAHVAGLSWGGTVALELYRRHPESVASLILADTYAGWKGSLSAEECAERLSGVEQMLGSPVEDLARAWLPGLVSPDAPSELAEELIAIMSDARPRSIAIALTAMAGCDQRDVLPRIEVPTLLLWGEADRRSPVAVARQFLDAIPGARLTLIPGTGHVSNMEQPERFNAALRAFCRRVSKTSATAG